MPALPPPPDPVTTDRSASERWVAAHLADLTDGSPVVGSPAFRGGQTAADAALAGLDVTGYAARRSEVWPPARRGASRVSPYVRHGLLGLRELWQHVADAPSRDRVKYRDELLWQEYARHWYARLGTRTARPLRHELPSTVTDADPWDRTLRCVDVTVDELERDGWLVNQTRMWLASHWSVRHGAAWRDGEDRFFRHLLDGSRAANRLGWQWTTGAGSHRAYGFSRAQVERRAPALCGDCPLAHDCPVEAWPPDPTLLPVPEPEPLLRRDPDLAATAGPRTVERTGAATAVWLTAESLGDADPALAARPDLPAVFVFDEPLLRALRLHPRRLVFLAETLGDLATRREVEVLRGDPVTLLAGRPLAATVAPVPGWRRRAAVLDVVERHPWPWLRWPHARSIASFSAWREHLTG